MRNWAVAATAIALVLLGVLIGQRLSQPTKPDAKINDSQEVNSASNAEINSNVDGTVGSEREPIKKPEAFIIPAAFTSIPSEWHTVIIENGFDGYAILFNPTRREVIIEKCRHPGYFDLETGQPFPEGVNFCTNVLWGQLLVMDERSAKVQARSGGQLELSLSLTAEDGQSQLALSFPGHQMKLVPGSKNDLFQAMERSPTMVEQKKQKFEFFEAKRQKDRK